MKQLISLSVAALLAGASVPAYAQNVDLTAVMAQIEAMKSRIAQLEAQVELANQTASKADATASQAKVTASQANEAAEVAIENIEQGGSGGFVNSAMQGVSIGGYGELHYNDLDSGSEIDFHRFVLFFGKEFTENLRFFSEFELEHALAGDGKPGEVELEQAYIEYDFGGSMSAKAGLFLVPVGILNETHEPPTFFGTERNKVEAEIIPSTWWEAGTAITGRNDKGFSYDVALHSGLKVPTQGNNAYRIRSGRQKVAEAIAEDFAITGRVRYTGIPGLELALTAQHQSDITQGIDDASATLIEAHAVYRSGPFGIRALYAGWDIDSANADALGKDSQYGFFLEPSWSFNDNWGVFARYSEYNTFDGLADSEAIEQVDFGVNWYLHENVVLKADVQNQSGAKNDDGFNLGVGYNF